MEICVLSLLKLLDLLNAGGRSFGEVVKRNFFKSNKDFFYFAAAQVFVKLFSLCVYISK